MRTLVTDKDLRETKPCDYIFKKKLRHSCSCAIFHRFYFHPSCQVICSSYNITCTSPFPWQTNRANKIHFPFIKGLQCNLWRKWHFVMSWWFLHLLALVTITTVFSCIHMYSWPPESNLKNLAHHCFPNIMSSWDTRMCFPHYPLSFMLKETSSQYFIWSQLVELSCY